MKRILLTNQKTQKIQKIQKIQSPYQTKMKTQSLMNWIIVLRNQMKTRRLQTVTVFGMHVIIVLKRRMKIN